MAEVNTEEFREARIRRMAADVASLVKRADTVDMRLRSLEDFAANAQRFFATILAQQSDMADMLRRLDRRLDVNDATDAS